MAPLVLSLFFFCVLLDHLNPPSAHAAPTQTAPPETLESFFPSLQERVKKIPLLKGRTPLTPLSGLEAHFDIQSPGTLLVKRDDLSQEILGGNKARKLEYLLGEAQARGARSIITAGMLGSNHALATTVAGRAQGYRVHLHLGPQPVTENVKKKLLAFKALGADLHHHSTSIGLGFAIAKAMLLDTLSGGTVFHIPPGGSSPTGSLGYINGYLEMARQLEETQTPLPEQIVVPVGEYRNFNPVFTHPKAFPRGVGTALMGGEQEVLRVPRRVNAKSFARFRALPRLRSLFFEEFPYAFTIDSNGSFFSCIALFGRPFQRDCICSLQSDHLAGLRVRRGTDRLPTRRESIL